MERTTLRTIGAPEPATPTRAQRHGASSSATVDWSRRVSSSAVRSAPPAGVSIGTTVGRQEGSVDFGALPAREVPGFDHVVVLMGENRSFDNLLGLALHARDPARGRDLRRPRIRRPREHRTLGRARRRSRLLRRDGRRDGQAESRPGRGVPARQHPALRHGRSAVERDERDRRDGRAVQRAARGDARRRSTGSSSTTGTTSPGSATARSRRSRRRPTSWAASRPSSCPCSPRWRASSRSSTPGSRPCRRRPTATDRSSTRRPRTASSRTRTAAATTNGWMPRPRRRSSTVSKRPGVSWKVYFDELQLVSLTGVMHAPALEEFWRTEHFVHMSEFYKDARGRHAARLRVHRAAPRLQPQRLPPARRASTARATSRADWCSTPPCRMCAPARSSSPRCTTRSGRARHRDGSNAVNTLLLITFDEHGGTYDHVAPPAATPPVADAGAG